jgi:hypothetical protein
VILHAAAAVLPSPRRSAMVSSERVRSGRSVPKQPISDVNGVKQDELHVTRRYSITGPHLPITRPRLTRGATTSAPQGTNCRASACSAGALALGVGGRLLPERTNARWTQLRRVLFASRLTASVAIACLAIATIRQGISWMWWIPVCRSRSGRIVSHAGLSQPAMEALIAVLTLFAIASWLGLLCKRYEIGRRVG